MHTSTSAAAPAPRSAKYAIGSGAALAPLRGCIVGHHDQQVVVAIGAGISPRHRTKEINALGPIRLPPDGEPPRRGDWIARCRRPENSWRALPPWLPPHQFATVRQAQPVPSRPRRRKRVGKWPPISPRRWRAPVRRSIGAYQIVGRLVLESGRKGKKPSEWTPEEMRRFAPEFTADFARLFDPRPA